MPAWGVKSGKGALNEQSIQDLVNYLYSINTTPEKAQAGAAKDADAMRETLESPEVRAAAAKWVADTTVQLELAPAALAALPNHAECRGSQHGQQRRGAGHRERRGRARVATDHVGRDRRQHPLHGQLRALSHARLVVLRSHQPAREPGTRAPMGGGAFGPNLTEGDVDQQFPPPLYDDDFFGWISAGVPAFDAYGTRGISSGRMPHFGAVLTKEQIEAIMEYERSL